MSGGSGKSHWGLALVLIIAALVVGGILRAGLLRLPDQAALHPQKVSVTVATEAAPVSLGTFKNGFASVIDPALPAIVNISSTKVVKAQNTPGIFNDPLFRQFFGEQFNNPGPTTERQYSLGSGVIVNPNGYIVTNNHVVADASDVEVFTQGRRKYKAMVVGTDARTDIAIVKIDATQLPTLTLGDSNSLKVGDLVFAIGDPFGIGETATTGIVSATGRALGEAIEHYEDFIQTDAAINPGNSGGALIDLHGDLIGINTAIISGGSGGNQGIGFAIPINLAHGVMDQITEHGKVIRGYLGVTIQAVDPDMAKAFGLNQGGGALVSDVTPDGPAAKAGIQRGDVILQLNGQTINSSEDLSLQIGELAPGAVAHLQVFRNGQTREIGVTLGELPEQAAAAQGNSTGNLSLAGIHVENLTPGLAEQLGLPQSTAGVLVASVDPSSPASAALQQGDVIQEVNRMPVRNVQEYQQALAAVKNQSVLLLVNHQGMTHYVVIQPQ